MRPVVIVFGVQCSNHSAGMSQRREQVFVWAFLARPYVEIFDEAVLDRFAGYDVVPTDFVVFLSF